MIARRLVAVLTALATVSLGSGNPLRTAHAAQVPATAPSTTGEHAHHDASPAPSDEAPCDVPGAECCAAMPGCTVVFDAVSRADVLAQDTPAVGLPRFSRTRPPSMTSAPEPPPPRR